MNATQNRFSQKADSDRPARARYAALAIAAALFASPLFAEDCRSSATVGNFELTFEGADYDADADATLFSYCITGLDVPGFHALSDWVLELDPSCIDEEDLLTCEPGPCFYQVDDPNSGITGIKFDEVEIDAGETECFGFALEGDYTGTNLGEVVVGLKAANDVSFGNVCGPICHNCSSSLRVLTPPGEEPIFNVRVIHNRAETVVTPIWYTIVDAANNKIHQWKDRPVEFVPHSKYRFFGPLPGLPTLEPGTYRFMMQLQGMNGWVRRVKEFSIEQTTETKK